MKICRKCCLEKSLDEFYTRSGTSDGKKTECKQCTKAAVSSNYVKTRDKRLKYAKQYQSENKEKIAKYLADYRSENKEELVIKKSEWYFDNKEEIAEKSLKYRKDNAEKISKQKRKNYLKTKHKVAEWGRKYRKTPKGRKIRAKSHSKRYAVKRGAEIVEDIIPLDVFRNSNWTCFYCKKEVNKETANNLDEATLDHIIPLSKGGSHTLSNIVCCCRSCNSRKGTKSLKTFLKIIKEEI